MRLLVLRLLNWLMLSPASSLLGSKQQAAFQSRLAMDIQKERAKSRSAATNSVANYIAQMVEAGLTIGSFEDILNFAKAISSSGNAEIQRLSLEISELEAQREVVDAAVEANDAQLANLVG